MIPQFPKFKKLELEDKSEIEQFTSQFQPYSDFNFINLWCWDVDNKTEISKTASALIVKFIDYVTGDLTYSFLSSSNCDELAKDLLESLSKQNLKPELKLIPQISAKHLNSSTFEVVEDLDNFDYIYDLEKLVSYKGKFFETKRNLLNRFVSKYKKNNIQTQVLDLNNSDIRKQIIFLSNVWEKNKNVVLKNETTAMHELFEIHDQCKLIVVGIFIDADLVAFCFNELLKHNYAISHFTKANIKYSSGIYAYLMQENARILIMHDKTLLNYQQDLGISSLRYAKKSFRPAFFLKKYRVCLKNRLQFKNVWL